MTMTMMSVVTHEKSAAEIAASIRAHAAALRREADGLDAVAKTLDGAEPIGERSVGERRIGEPPTE
jgi:hypothetical protein